MIGKSDKF